MELLARMVASTRQVIARQARQHLANGTRFMNQENELLALARDEKDKASQLINLL